LLLSQFTHCALTSSGSTEDEDNVLLGFSRVCLMDDDCRCRSDTLLVDLPRLFAVRKLSFTGALISQMTVESSDSPCLIGARVGERRLAFAFTIGAIPSQLTIPVS